MKIKGKEINCPICHIKVMTYRSLSLIPLCAVCKGCNKLIIYDGLTKKITVSKKPYRQTSSGMRFY